MKKVFIACCMICCVGILNAQLKVSLSYQLEQTEATAGEKSNGTLQADAIWQFSPYISTYSGIGYSSRTVSSYNYDINSPFICICCWGDCYLPDPSTPPTRLSNLEVPIGVRFNTPSFYNFEIGLSVGMAAVVNVARTSTEDEIITSTTERGVIEEINTVTTTTNDWNYAGSRVDVGLDIQYNISKAWQARLTGTISPLAWRSNGNAIGNFLTDHEYRPLEIRNNQSGLRLSVIRGF